MPRPDPILHPRDPPFPSWCRLQKKCENQHLQLHDNEAYVDTLKTYVIGARPASYLGPPSGGGGGGNGNGGGEEEEEEERGQDLERESGNLG